MQDLVPIRYGRMSASPFAYFRGSAAVMAADLAVVQPHARLEALVRMLIVAQAPAALVFARTRAGCAECRGSYAAGHSS